MDKVKGNSQKPNEHWEDILVTDSEFKIHDYFIISSYKFKRGW